MEKLVELMQEKMNLSDKSFKEVLAITNFREIKKDTVFIEENKVNNFEYLLLDGVCRNYLYNLDGEQVTISFYQAFSILTPKNVRVQNGKSLYNFQALTDIILGEIPADLFLQLMIDNIEIREFGNFVLTQELYKKVNKEIAFVSQTAKERLLQFRNDYRMLENLVPHSQIASYLGITNISLSRIRNELMK